MESTRRESLLAGFELSASVAWLAMDFAWMEQQTALAVTCALPMTVCSLLAIVFARRDFTARAVVAAMAAWAVMNSFWMMNDLDVYQGLWAARACFVLGLGLLGAALLASGSVSAVLREVLSSFRRLRAK